MDEYTKVYLLSKKIVLGYNQYRDEVYDISEELEAYKKSAEGHLVPFIESEGISLICITSHPSFYGKLLLPAINDIDNFGEERFSYLTLYLYGELKPKYSLGKSVPPEFDKSDRQYLEELINLNGYELDIENSKFEITGSKNNTINTKENEKSHKV